MRITTLMASLGLLTASAPAAEAHHSRTMFNIMTTVGLVGTVRLFQWNNPHCYIQLTVPGDDGTTREYSVEMGAPLHLQGRGWTPRTLRPGDQVRVTIYPMRSGDAGGELASITRMDGSAIGRTN